MYKTSTCGVLLYETRKMQKLQLINLTKPRRFCLLLNKNVLLFYISGYFISLVGWYYLNKLELNISKFYVVQINHKLNVKHFNYFIANNKLQSINYVRDLGVILDPQFSHYGYTNKVIFMSIFQPKRGCYNRHYFCNKRYFLLRWYGNRAGHIFTML